MSHLTAVYGMFGERDWRWSIAWEDPTVEPLLGDFTDDELSELCALRERMLRHMPDRDERAYLTLDARGRVGWKRGGRTLKRAKRNGT